MCSSDLRLFDAFCLRYDQVYGHHTRNPARFVNLRVVQRAANRADAISPAAGGAKPGTAADKGSRRVLLAGAADYVTAKVYDRDGLAPGDAVAGPAIIEQSDTTTLIDPGWTAKVADNGVLLMTREAA